MQFKSSHINSFVSSGGARLVIPIITLFISACSSNPIDLLPPFEQSLIRSSVPQAQLQKSQKVSVEDMLSMIRQRVKDDRQ